MDIPDQNTRSEAEARVVAGLAMQAWKAEAIRFQEVHDRSPDGMMIFRSVRGAADEIVDFEWLYCNPSASRIVGRQPAELLGKKLLTEMPGNKEAGLFDIYVGVVEGSEPHSHEFSYRHEGLDNWFRATSIKLADGFYVAFSDITLRKRAEEHAARLAAIVRSSEHAIYSTSAAGLVETWNQGAEKLFGYTSDEMVGQNILATIPEQYRAEHQDALLGILGRGGVESFQTTRQTKGGALVHVSVMLSPIGDIDDRVVGTAVIARDISEQVKLQERLIVADRMASVGTLAAGMAHEINNPLAYLSANLDMMLEELNVLAVGSTTGALKELQGMAVEAQGGARRITEIVRRLTIFSRADEDRPALVDVASVLDLSVSMALGELRGCAQLVKEYGLVPSVIADEARLGQVFINLLVNAAQAIGDGNADTNEIRIVTTTDEKGRVVVEVRDTGPGIAPKLINRVFEPFFSTKPIGGGAGLGLSICRNIVTGMGGEITASSVGRGTTFRVVLPAALPLPTALADRPWLTATALRRAAVLVVDDEPAIGKILARILRDHDVTVLTKARDALALLASDRHFDVILSDLMMPEMSGMDLFEQLRGPHPDVATRFVFITGGVVQPGANKFLDKIDNERMCKPFDPEKVRAVVQRFIKE